MYSQFCHDMIIVFCETSCYKKSCNKTKAKIRKFWPIIQTYTYTYFRSGHSNHVTTNTYKKVGVIQTVFNYLSVTLQPIFINKICIVAELAVLGMIQFCYIEKLWHMNGIILPNFALSTFASNLILYFTTSAWLRTYSTTHVCSFENCSCRL
jgi:hypothetical protein